MESEKKNNKILIVLLVILSILVLGLSGYIVYDKIISNKDTKASIEDSNKINNNNNNNNKNETEVKNTISENEALSIGNELWKYAYSTFWGDEPAWKSHYGEVNEYGGSPIICDTTIEQVKQKYSSDFKAQTCYSDGSNCIDYTIDTFIPQNTCQGAGRGGLQNYKDTSLTVKDIKDDKIVFTATSAYCSSSFCHESNDTTKEIKRDFVIIKQNNNWLIDYFYLPN